MTSLTSRDICPGWETLHTWCNETVQGKASTFFFGKHLRKLSLHWTVILQPKLKHLFSPATPQSSFGLVDKC